MSTDLVIIAVLLLSLGVVVLFLTFVVCLFLRYIWLPIWTRIADPDPLDSEREYLKRGTPGDREE